MKFSWQKALVLLLAVPLAVFLALQAAFFWRYFRAHRDPEKFLLTDGYRGWAIVEYGDPACPELTVRAGYRVVPISESGEACTSSAWPRGWGDDVFAYSGAPRDNLMSHPQEGENLIWHERSVSERFYVFYVGFKLSRDDLERGARAVEERIAGRNGVRLPLPTTLHDGRH